MIMLDLVDREEVKLDGSWYVLEYITVECPECKDSTNIVITGPEQTEYYHDYGRTCVVENGS